jgi:hypothetical protein
MSVKALDELTADGQACYSVQQPAGTAHWTAWSELGSSVVGVPAAWLDAAGTPAVAVLDGNLRIAVASYAPAGWSGWAELGTGF